MKLEKYVWKVREMRFLRVVIGLDGINIEKKAYRWFVKDFTRIAKPLYEIIRKDIKWNWREKQQKVLQTQNFKVSQEKEPRIRVKQENSMENSIQDCPSYILKLHGLC